MKSTSLTIPDVKLIDPVVHGDDRGFFLETWSSESFASEGLDISFVQDNWSRSTKGVLRGLHYQIRHPQGKLVRCVSGSVFDVAVDLRRSSPSFGAWIGEVLSEENKRSMWIPPGFAHGFLTLSETADFQYKCSDIYFPSAERTLAWNDPSVGVDWPLPGSEKPIMSGKDEANAVPLDDADCFN